MKEIEIVAFVANLNMHRGRTEQFSFFAVLRTLQVTMHLVKETALSTET